MVVVSENGRRDRARRRKGPSQHRAVPHQLWVLGLVLNTSITTCISGTSPPDAGRAFSAEEDDEKEEELFLTRVCNSLSAICHVWGIGSVVRV